MQNKLRHVRNAILAVAGLAAMSLTPAASAAVTATLNLGTTCSGTSSSPFTIGTPVQVTLCVSTNTEPFCGSTVRFASASVAENGAFQITARLNDSLTLIDPTVGSPGFPITIVDTQTTDLGYTAQTPPGTPQSAGANQALETFTIIPTASATNSSYVISLINSLITTTPTDCSDLNVADAPISASFTFLQPLTVQTVLKSFGAPSIPLSGGTTLLTIHITNPNAGSGLTGLAFTDTLPGGLVVATPNNLNSTCGGTATAAAGGSTVSLTGGTLAGGASCDVTVNVTGTTAGNKANAVFVTSAEGGTSTTSNASLAVVASPSITKQFGSPSIVTNGTTTLQFTITNPVANSVPLTGVGFIDVFPAGLVVSSPNGVTGSCGGGTITAAAGAGQVTLTGATIATGGSCSFTVNVTGTTQGSKPNTTAAVTSTNGGTGNSASATLNVINSIGVTKAFTASQIPLNGTTTLTFTLTNPNAGSGLTGVAFTDALASGLVVASPNGLTNTCGGTATATAGSGTVSLTGGTIASAGSCTLAVTVTGTTIGVKPNSVTATSTETGQGNTSNASVTVVGPVSASKAFGAPNIASGGTTSLSFTLVNNNPTVALTGVGFTDPLTSGLTVATPNGLTGTCGGGTITAVAGSSTVSLAGATLAANASCTFSVNVVASQDGPVANVTSTVSSAEGGSGAAATATVFVGDLTPATPRIIPTLSEIGLLLLSLMMAGAAGYAVRRRT